MRLGESVELRTRAIARRAGILHLLPEKLNEEWPLSGRILENGERGSWKEEVEPKIANVAAKFGLSGNDGYNGLQLGGLTPFSDL